MKEIAIARCADENLWSISCSIHHVTKRLHKLTEEWETEHLTTTSGDYTCFKLPIKAVFFRKPRRLTPEQRAEARERLKEVLQRSKRRVKTEPPKTAMPQAGE